jgi:hypothetical protein
MVASSRFDDEVALVQNRRQLPQAEVEKLFFSVARQPLRPFTICLLNQRFTLLRN